MSRTFDTSPPGQYTITETLPSGWLLDAISCVDATGDTVVDVGSGSAVVQLAADELVTCTFRNEALPACRPGQRNIVALESQCRAHGPGGIDDMGLAEGLGI